LYENSEQARLRPKKGRMEKKMNQDDIFKLLLVVLLITNEQDNRCHHDGCGIFSRFSSLNEIIIIALLLNAFSNPGRDGDDRNRTERGERCCHCRDTAF